MGSAQTGVVGSSLANPGALSAASGVKHRPLWHIVAPLGLGPYSYLAQDLRPAPLCQTMEQEGGSCLSQGLWASPVISTVIQLGQKRGRGVKDPD